eukprot:354001-Chlamydomonas_euryale.AAC.2
MQRKSNAFLFSRRELLRLRLMHEAVREDTMLSVPSSILTANACRQRTSTHDSAECGRGRCAW